MTRWEDMVLAWKISFAGVLLSQSIKNNLAPMVSESVTFVVVVEVLQYC